MNDNQFPEDFPTQDVKLWLEQLKKSQKTITVKLPVDMAFILICEVQIARYLDDPDSSSFKDMEGMREELYRVLFQKIQLKLSKNTQKVLNWGWKKAGIVFSNSTNPKKSYQSYGHQSNNQKNWRKSRNRRN